MRQPEFFGSGTQTSVICPHRQASHESGGSKQVDIDITNTEPEQLMLFDELQDFVRSRDCDLRKAQESCQDGLARAEISQRKLADDEWMDQHLTGVEQGRKSLVLPA